MKIRIFDTTLRDGEQSPGCSMNISEKLETAGRLEALGVDVIEAGFPASSPGDREAVSLIADSIKNCSVAALCRASRADIDAAAESLKNAADPLIHVFISVSPIHLEYKLKMSEDEAVERAADAIKYARKFTDNIEFSAEDAFRTPMKSVIRIVEAAAAAGAKIVNLPDTVGYAMPNEVTEFFTCVRQNANGADKLILSAHCHNDLGNAVANSLAAVIGGAGQVECTVNGIGERAGNAALEEIVMSLETRKDFFKAETGIDTKKIYPTSRLIQTITGIQIQPNKPVVGDNAFSHEAGIHQHVVLEQPLTYEIMSPEKIGMARGKLILGKHSGRHAFEEHLEYMGYNLSKEEIDRAFKKFKDVADKKKNVLDKDIEAIILGTRKEETVEHYSMVNFVINSGNTISATAKIRLSSETGEEEEVALGEGPVDALFNAINKIVKMDIVLDDYSVHAVTEGVDALGESIVKLKRGSSSVTGRGLSTDVIEASIKAYLNGVNKLISEDKR